MFIQLLDSDAKHQYGLYRCDFCSAEYRTRIRSDRKNDNCGCRGSRLKHGDEVTGKPTPELKCYRKIKERCFNVNCKDYVNYGGRGITVCSRWLDSYENFLADMGRKPSATHSIDRIDVNGPYSPENCRWVTKKMQANNTRTNQYITIDGITHTVSQWLEIMNVSKTVFYRYLKQGVPSETILKTKSRMAGGN